MEEFIQHGYDLLKKYNLTKWNIEINRAKRAYGMAVWPNRTIKISQEVMNAKDKNIFEDIFMHEVTHAIDFERRGSEGGAHDKCWKSICREFGVNPSRTVPEWMKKKVKVEKKYTFTCPECNETFGMYRKSRSTPYYCRNCFEKTGDYIRFNIRQNY